MADTSLVSVSTLAGLIYIFCMILFIFYIWASSKINILTWDVKYAKRDIERLEKQIDNIKYGNK